MNQNLFIGLTGRMGSGKGEVMKIFSQYGFQSISLSDIIRLEAQKKGHPVDRNEMQNIGNQLRLSEGSEVLAKRIREHIINQPHPRWIIDGIRNPAEIDELKKLNNFYLIGIETQIDIILDRLKKRQRDTDQISDKELMKRLKREWGQGEPKYGQLIEECMARADFIISNNSSLTDLHQQVLNVLNNIGVNHE